MSCYDLDQVADVLRRARLDAAPDSQLRHALEVVESLLAIIETATDLIATATVDGHVLYMNRSAREFLRSRETRTVSDAHPPWAAKLVMEEGIPSAIANGYWRGETVFLGPEGREIWHSQTILRHNDAEGRPAFLSMIARDISEHTQLVEKLKSSESKFRDIFDNAPVGIFHTDIAGRSGMMNPAMARMLGFESPEHAIGELTDVATQIYAVPEDRRRMIEQAARTDGFMTFRTRFRRRDGALRHVRMQVRMVRRADGNPLHLEGFCEDVTEQVRAEDALRRGESRYRAVIEDQTELIVRWKPDGIRVFANEAYCRCFGLEPEECIGTAFWPLVHPDDRDAVARKIAGLTAEHPVAEDIHRSFLPDGSLAWQEWTDRAIFDAEGRAVEYQSVGRDVTRRKMAQDALQESERRLDLALEGAGLGLWDVDLPGGLIHIDERLARLTRYGEHGLTERLDRLAARMEPSDFSAANAAFERHVSGAAPRLETEVRQTVGGGEQLWIRAVGRITVRDDEGRPVRMTGIAADVTERKQAEEELTAHRRDLERLVRDRTAALEESQQHLRTVIEAMPIALFAVDPDRTFSFYLGKDVEIGFDPSGMLGRPLREVLAGRGDIGALVETAFAGESSSAVFALKNGRHFEVFCMPRRGGGAIGLAIDVTERQRTMASLRKAEEHLRETQRLEAVGRLAGGVAHDFNNMMTVVTMYSTRLMRRAADAETLRGLEAINATGHRAARLTRQLLAFASRQILKPREMSLNEVLRMMEPMLRGLVGESVAIALDLNEGISPVKADPAQIEQVIVNLVANARDAMPHGGRLRISTRNRAVGEGERATFGGGNAPTAPGNYVELSVEDSGEGITPENMKRIFEPFFTTREFGKGTGLGLPAAYGVMRQSGGYIFAESEPGKGSTFTIMLPAAGSPDFDAASTRVIVVEDDDQVRGALVDELEERGYFVMEAADGESALALCRNLPRPDVLLADIVLPGISGRELHQRLATECGITKALFISGHSAESIQGPGEPGTDFLQKPFDTDELDRRLRGLLSRKRPEEPVTA